MKDLNFIQRLTKRLGILYEATVFNFYGLILLALIFLFYWNFPQAKDLLLTLNQEGPIQITLFFITLVTMASINWYFPRYLYPENNSKLKSWRSFFNADMNEHRVSKKIETFDNEQAYKMRMIEMIPRLVGAYLLMIVGLGVLNVGHEMDPSAFPWLLPAGILLLGLLLFTAVLLLVGKTGNPWMFAFSDWLMSGINKWIYFFLTIVAVLLGVFLFFNKGDFASLKFLMFSIVLCSFAFLFITMARKQIAFVKNDNWVIRIICLFSVGLSLYFILINLIPNWSQKLNPLICANLAFIFYLTIFYFFRILGVSKKIYFVFFFLLIVLIAANITTSAEHHEISYSSGEGAKFDSEKRKDIYQYFQHWIDQRAPEIEKYLAEHHAADSNAVARYPVVIVSSEGGGSRAAYWTNIVHNHLDQKIPGFFDNHLFALTGASGGNTGNSTYFSMKRAQVNQDSIPTFAQRMFKGNFLSSSLTLLLGSDFWKSTFGFSSGEDRAKQLEREWTNYIAKATNQKVTNFSSPFLGFWYESKTNELIDQKAPPLLIINTTHVQGGGHAVMSPVKFNEKYYKALDLLYAVDTMSNGEQTIPLSTAVLLNASFPYINPAGNVKNVGSFVDAGYYDNYGATAGEGVLEHLYYLRNFMKEADTPNSRLYAKLRFISVLIRNGTVDDIVSTDPASSQLLAPASTIGNLRTGFGTNNKWELQHAADLFQYYRINLPSREKITILLEGETDSISPIIPLARYLSESALDAMDEGLRVLERDSNSDLNRLIKTIK